MLHSLRLSNGLATYCNRYIKTHKYMLERDAGFPIIPNMLSGFYGLLDIFRFLMVMKRIMIGHLDIMKGIGVANTSLAFVSGKLLALCESDLPYIVNLTQQGDIETLGRWDFDKKLLSNMTAHPKVDMETKETFAFSWSFTFPHLTFFRIDEKGVKHNEVPIFSMHKPSLIHDFALTKSFAIFHETQLIFSLAKVLTGRGFNAAHIINPWENGTEEIVFVASNVKTVKDFLFNRKLGIVLGKEKKTRYAYLGVLDETPKTSGLVKIDLETGNEVGRRFYGLGCFGGEPFFVRRNSDEDVECEEDDGFVMTYVHNEHTDETIFLLMDAQSPEFTTIAAVKLPRRVPYGFHGLFLTN
ncbi:Nine-cis-epoxycarotenoid dioxygenase 4 [Theobroma cacao]|uniref:Nine-cis-epoxycarotenoid dioxygenase 4 n=1 Tax=Theobroma cacao TaxID=3641 RepID=A0A061FAU8_THECC|nr:Nine-cis-epoxycarotenoid dioxygenase 4 [Theobroma cacao]